MLHGLLFTVSPVFLTFVPFCLQLHLCFAVASPLAVFRLCSHSFIRGSGLILSIPLLLWLRFLPSVSWSFCPHALFSLFFVFAGLTFLCQGYFSDFLEKCIYPHCIVWPNKEPSPFLISRDTTILSSPGPSKRRHRCMTAVLLVVPSAPSLPVPLMFLGSYAPGVVRAKLGAWLWPKPYITSQVAGCSCLSGPPGLIPYLI